MKGFRWIAAFAAAAAGMAAAQVSYQWTDITPPGGGVMEVGTHVLEGNRLVVRGEFQPAGAFTTFHPVMYSDDYGKTWKLPETKLPLPVLHMLVDDALPGVVYLAEDSNLRTTLMGLVRHEGHVYRSDDFGRTWSVASTVPIGKTIAPFGIDPLDTRGLYASYAENYVDGSCPGLCTGTAFTSVVRSSIGGADWSAPAAMPADSRYFVGPTPSAPRRLFAASRSAGLYQSLDGGASWSKFPSTSGANLWMRADPLRPNVLYGSFYYLSISPGISYTFLVRSQDGGATWRQIHQYAPDFAGFAIDPARPNVVWSASESSNFSRSENRGDTWSLVPYPGSGAPPSSITFSPAEPNVVYVVRSGRLYRGNAVLPQPIVTEYEYEGDRYWLTSLGGEAVFQDNRQQPGDVHRTGQRWGAWLPGDAPAGAVGSCRFWPKPETGVRTRVIVLQGPECEFLRANPGWILEAENEFQAVPPRDGMCPAGLLAVHRMPNMKADLNFRWVVDPAVIAQMRERGWVDEGVVMCARPMGSNE